MEAIVAVHESADEVVGLDVRPARIAGRRGAFRVAVTNKLSSPTTVTLAARDREGLLRVRVDPAGPVVVPPYGTVRATVHVAPPSSAEPAKAQDCEIEVYALHPAHDNPYLVRSAARAQFAYTPGGATPRLLKWLPVPVALVLLGCGFVVYAAMAKAHAPKSYPAPTGTLGAHSLSQSGTIVPTIVPTLIPTVTPPAFTPTATPTPRPSPSPHARPLSASRRAAAVFVVTVPTTLRTRPKGSAARTVLVAKGQHVIAMGAATAHWQYVTARGHRQGWVLKTHLRRLR